MSQTQANEIAFQINEKAGELNDLILRASANGLLVRINILERSDIQHAEPIPLLTADVWRKL